VGHFARELRGNGGKAGGRTGAGGRATASAACVTRRRAPIAQMSHECIMRERGRLGKTERQTHTRPNGTLTDDYRFRRRR